MSSLVSKDIEYDKGIDLDEIADRMENYSGADIRLMCKDASLMHVRRWIQNKSPEDILQMKERPSFQSPVTKEDFEKALETSSPSVKSVERYERWNASYGTLQ